MDKLEFWDLNLMVNQVENKFSRGKLNIQICDCWIQKQEGQSTPLITVILL